jgi:predicted DCC family thiol-disulfide oxidoreductase YuxK
MNTVKQKKPILLFDGSCGLCSGIIQFILKLGRGSEFYYVPLESPEGRYLTGTYTVSAQDDDTVMIIDEGVVYKKSDAAIFVLKHLEGWWRLLSWVSVVPRWLRDAIYDVVAKNRRVWFGMSSSCLIPPPRDEQLLRRSGLSSSHSSITKLDP